MSGVQLLWEVLVVVVGSFEHSYKYMEQGTAKAAKMKTSEGSDYWFVMH